VVVAGARDRILFWWLCLARWSEQVPRSENIQEQHVEEHNWGRTMKTVVSKLKELCDGGLMRLGR
jgi:hypothetical protein